MAKLLCAGAASATLAACGGEKKSYESISVPVGTIDLGESRVESEGESWDGRSFKVKNELVGKLSCGAVIETDSNGKEERQAWPRKIIPAGDKYSQVNCYFDNFPQSDKDIEEARSLEVKFADK